MSTTKRKPKAKEAPIEWLPYGHGDGEFIISAGDPSDDDSLIIAHCYDDRDAPLIAAAPRRPSRKLGGRRSSRPHPLSGPPQYRPVVPLRGHTMRITIFVTEDGMQFNLTPESALEKRMMTILRDHSGPVRVHHGANIERTRGEFIRDFGDDSESVAITIDRGT